MKKKAKIQRKNRKKQRNSVFSVAFEGFLEFFSLAIELLLMILNPFKWFE